MALHRHVDDADEERRIDPWLSVYDRPESLPRLRIPDDPIPPNTAERLVRSDLILDGNARQNLATFVTTWMEPEARSLMTAALDKNIVDKDEYPQTAEIERRCVNILADLWHADPAAQPVGKIGRASCRERV